MNKYILIFLVVAYLIFSDIWPRVNALSFEAKNVTLILDGCNDESCYLRGTWKKDPLTLNHILVQKDGSEIWFMMEDIQMLSVPTKSAQ